MKTIQKITLMSLFLCASVCSGLQGEDGKTLNVCVDPRIELLSVVQAIGGYEGYLTRVHITPYNFAYKRELLKRFTPYNKHEAVKMMLSLSNHFNCDAPVTTMLHLGNPPLLEVKSPLTDYLIGRAGGKEKLDQFISALRGFAEESKFMDFYKENKEFYSKIEAGVKSTMKGSNYVSDIEDYYGMTRGAYTLTLGPLLHPGGYGPRVERDDGSLEVFYIGGPKGVYNGLPVWGDSRMFRYIVWHEFSHSFVNPTTDIFADEVNRYSSLMDPIAEEMKDMSYPDWTTCVNEHLVRAITVRLACKHLGEEEGKASLKLERIRNFSYVRELCDKLKIYEKERENYPSFIDFYPELVKVFKNLADQDLGEDYYIVPFSEVGTMNRVYTNKKSLIYIVSTMENDKKDQERLEKYVQSIRDTFSKKSPILTDAEALERDLSSNNIVVYGTLDGNLWLKKHFASLAKNIKRDRIVTSRDFQGSGLRFMTAMPNPLNRNLGVNIYTAQEAKDIIGVNSVSHGSSDYVVAKGTNVLQSAEYKKTKAAWSF